MTNIPQSLLAATLADGTTVAEQVGTEIPMLEDLDDQHIADLRQVWMIRRDIDIPILRDLQRISPATAERLISYISELLAFIDAHRSDGIRFYMFSKAKVIALYSPSRENVFVFKNRSLVVAGHE